MFCQLNRSRGHWSLLSRCPFCWMFRYNNMYNAAAVSSHLLCRHLLTHSLGLLACRFLVVTLAVRSILVVAVIQEHVLVSAVGGEGDGGDAEAGEGAPEAVESRERAGVSPRLTVHA